MAATVADCRSSQALVYASIVEAQRAGLKKKAGQLTGLRR